MKKETKPDIFPNHIAMYNGKAVDMSYETDKKKQFVRACIRTMDNARGGYVFTPKGEVFKLSCDYRTAHKVKDEMEKMKLLEEVKLLLMGNVTKDN